MNVYNANVMVTYNTPMLRITIVSPVILKISL